MSENLADKLKNYCGSDFYPLHMPGHKRRVHYLEQPFGIDITEIDGFDNLHHAEGILRETQQRAAALYGSDETFYLVNGSTGGILAAVSAVTSRGDRILMSRNCHKAAYHAVLLKNLRAVYLYPEVDWDRGISCAIRPQEVERQLQQYPDIRAVLITSPTYDGLVSDVRQIAEIVHRYGKILIVDEAHGAHFAMHPEFPESAVACGADLVINSLHKTMPSLTQTALLHVNGQAADRRRLRNYLGIYQTSSPSYVFMAGMDACVTQMQQHREKLFGDFKERLKLLREHLGELKRLHLVTGQEKELYAYAYDPSKVLISTEKAGINGPQLSEILRVKYHLEVEMEAGQYVTAIMTVCDEEEGFQRLEAALLEIDRQLTDDTVCPETGQKLTQHAIGPETGKDLKDHAAVCMEKKQGNRREMLHPQEAMKIGEAEEAEKECISLSESAGRISGEFVYLYPPGIPFLVPGERIPDNLPEQLAYDRSIGLKLQGLSDYSGQRIWVVREEKR